LFGKDLQDLAEALETLSQTLIKGRYSDGPRPKFGLDGASERRSTSLQPRAAAFGFDPGSAGTSDKSGNEYPALRATA
jgi:hypothetical protein